MQLYLSFSYRDVTINSHFLQLFLDQDIPLNADQKTDIWCLPKIERSVMGSDGFVSIIPRRATETNAAAFSQYIREEVNLARRARVPRLLFVDELVHRNHPLGFPADAIPFSPDGLADGSATQLNAMKFFRQTIDKTPRAIPRYEPRNAAVVVGREKACSQVAQDTAELLRREGFSITPLMPQGSGGSMPDVDLLEALWRAELCVFVLGERLSYVHTSQIIAHSHCIPSFRLQFDREAKDSSPGPDGLMRWSDRDSIVTKFGEQLSSYVKGVVRADELARTSGSVGTMQQLATSNWNKRERNLWDVTSIESLLRHVRPENPFVESMVHRAMSEFRLSGESEGGRAGSLDLCTRLYDSILRQGLAYGLEYPTSWQGVQAIRTSSEILAHRTATCIDAACLFAALLEGAHQLAIVVVVEGPGFAHALAGYRALDEPEWERPALADLVRAVMLGDAVVFEATGVLHSDVPVGAETRAERSEKTLIFSDATSAGIRMLQRPGVQLKGILDVNALRRAGVRVD